MAFSNIGYTFNYTINGESCPAVDGAQCLTHQLVVEYSTDGEYWTQHAMYDRYPGSEFACSDFPTCGVRQGNITDGFPDNSGDGIFAGVVGTSKKLGMKSVTVARGSSLSQKLAAVSDEIRMMTNQPVNA